jgi:hypothetical protein
MQDPMSVLLCIQIVQTNNNESNWREKKNKQLFDASKPKKRKVNLPRKPRNLIVNKKHKLIVKEFKLNVNCYIKTSKNHNLPQF